MLVKGNISISLWSKSLMQFCSYFDDILLILLIAHLNTNWARDMLVLTFDWDKSIHSSWIWKLKINKCFVNKLQEILTQMISHMISIKADKYIQVAPRLSTYLLVCESKTFKFDLAILFVHRKPVKVHITSHIEIKSAGVSEKFPNYPVCFKWEPRMHRPSVNNDECENDHHLTNTMAINTIQWCDGWQWWVYLIVLSL